MKKTSIILKEFGPMKTHDSRIEPVMQEKLQTRIRRMIRTHVVETPVGIPDFDDPENQPSKSMELRPEADFHSDRFDKAEQLYAEATTKYKMKEAQAEVARQATLKQQTGGDPSVNTPTE